MSVLVKKIALHVILPLIIGLIIYVAARPETWLVQKLLPFPFSFIDKNRDILFTDWFMKFIAFNGPDFCWSYSITSALLYWKHFSGIKIPYFPVLIFLLISVQEFVQLLFISHFTFDIMDMGAAVSAFILSLYLNRKYV
jgi:hypothetical protein